MFLQYNKLTHNCSSYSIFGVLSDTDLVVLDSTQGYAKRTSSSSDNVKEEGIKVAHYTWDDIEEQTGLRINTLIIDCEGCLFDLIDKYGHKFDQIKTVILENDENFNEGILDLLYFNGCGEKCQKVNKFLKSKGFKEQLVIKSLHYHYVFTKYS